MRLRNIMVYKSDWKSDWCETEGFLLCVCRLNACVCACACVCVCLSYYHTFPLILIVLLLHIIKITSLISTLSFYGIFPRKNSLTCILLLSRSLPPPLFFPRVYLSLLPTPTHDNHPKAWFSIKSVTLFHSHSAIHGIMHTNHSNIKLFFSGPVRKITAKTSTSTHAILHSMYTMNTSAQRQTNHAT